MSDQIQKEELNETEIVFFCKDTGEILSKEQVVRCGRKYVYKNKETGSKNVAFGTRRSVTAFYRLEEDKNSVKEEGKSAGPGRV